MKNMLQVYLRKVEKTSAVYNTIKNFVSLHASHEDVEVYILNQYQDNYNYKRDGKNKKLLVFNYASNTEGIPL